MLSWPTRSCVVFFVFILISRSSYAIPHQGLLLAQTPANVVEEGDRKTDRPSPRQNMLANIRQRRQLRSQFSAIEKWLPWGLLIVNAKSEVIFASRRAKSALKEGCGLMTMSGVFHADRACVDRGLRELIRLKITGAVPASESSAPNVIGVPDRNGRTRYAIRILPFDDQKGGGLALIAIVDLTMQFQIERSAAATVFRLSDREAEFAELFSAGLRVNDIAGRMRVAVNTARVHLRNVLKKTGCGSQIELARTFALLT